MKPKLLDILVCPACKGTLRLEGTEASADGEIETGTLECGACTVSYPVTRGIPRFVDPENYSSSFGFQWNRFKREQIDSFNGTDLSARRFWSETRWIPDTLRGNWMIDMGCGAGRFLDVSSVDGVEVVGLDISDAVDAAKDNLKGRPNVHLVQASIYDPPFAEGTFDNVYCIGVVQHTPSREDALRSIAAMAKPGGDVAVTIYPRKFYTKLYSKYWFRPITKRMEKERLLDLIEKIMPFAFAVTNVLFRIPLLGRVFMFAIPVANYVNETALSREQRYAWAVLDTFDMLSPRYDEPMTEAEVAKVFAESSIISMESLATGGLTIIGKKAR